MSLFMNVMINSTIHVIVRIRIVSSSSVLLLLNLINTVTFVSTLKLLMRCSLTHTWNTVNIYGVKVLELILMSQSTPSHVTTLNVAIQKIVVFQPVWPMRLISLITVILMLM